MLSHSLFSQYTSIALCGLEESNTLSLFGFGPLVTIFVVVGQGKECRHFPRDDSIRITAESSTAAVMDNTDMFFMQKSFRDSR